MRILLISLLLCSSAACSGLPKDPDIQFDPGFSAYAGCGTNGKSHSAKDNIVVRENGIVKFVRACHEANASL